MGLTLTTKILPTNRNLQILQAMPLNFVSQPLPHGDNQIGETINLSIRNIQRVGSQRQPTTVSQQTNQGL